MHALAQRSLGDSGEAEEVTQQVFLGVWRGRHGYRSERGAMGARIVGIARRRIADALSALTRRADLVASAGAALTLVGGHDRAVPEAVLDRMPIRAELAGLPAPQRPVLHLAFHEDLIQLQIAERTGLSLGTVKSRTRRGLRRLQSRLDGGPGGD